MQQPEIKPAVNRRENVDFTKGILIYLMVIFHIHYMGNFPGTFASLTTAVYAFHMPAFLFYTGFFANFKKNYTDQIGIVLRRIFIPYVIFETIYLLSLFLCSRIGLHFANSFTDFTILGLLNKVVLDPSGAYWYLHTITAGLIIALVIHHFFGKDKMTVIIFTGTAYWLLSLLLPHIHFGDCIFILIGMIFQLYEIELKPSIWAIIPMGLIIYFSLPLLVRNSMEGIAVTLLCISFLSAVYTLTAGSRLNRYICFIGKNTLMVMLIHPIFINMCRLFYPYVLKVDPTGFSNLVITAIITVGISVWLGKLLDRSKVSLLLFGRDVYVTMVPTK